MGAERLGCEKSEHVLKVLIGEDGNKKSGVEGESHAPFVSQKGEPGTIVPQINPQNIHCIPARLVLEILP